MNTNIRVQLSVMMFLQYFIWGAWFVTMGTYLDQTLKFEGGQIGLAYGTTAIAAMISPFFVGMIADRFFATQKVLAVLHMAGGALLYYASTANNFALFYPILIGHTLCYMPTLALTNTISFKQMKDPSKEFPSIRVLGTIGWIAAGLLIGQMKVEALATPMQVGAGASILMGFFCLFLPNTPPTQTGGPPTIKEILGLDALSMLKDPSFLVFVVGSLLICVPLTFYYNFTNLFLNELEVANAAGKMTMGQMSEIFFMLVMPFFFARLGVKKMLLVGMLAWTVRYFMFAFGDNQTMVWMLYGGIILHGICYDFFFVTGQIYVDKKAPDAIRSKAQGFLTFATLGVGMFIGSTISGYVVQHYSPEEGIKLWKQIWIVPAVGSLVVLLLFAFFFKDQGLAGRDQDETESA